jgi:Kef-type K+ transport system membrane component KefB/nucleotide-binding universal stress UspA family protein
VTGYLVAGIALGSGGVDLMGEQATGGGLEIFTNIALMLVAFGIGERFDLQQLRPAARALIRVSAGESLGTFLLVAVGVGLAAWATGTGGANGGWGLWIAVALVCASIAVATAPAATIAVIRELEASGPMSRLVLSSLVVNNVLSITLFGLAVAAARALLGTGGGSGLFVVLSPLVEPLASLALGVAVGLIIDIIVHQLAKRADVLIVARGAGFFCGGLASFLGLSALLAGVAAGFAVVNRDRRDVRAFRALNDFEPPLYGIFFALAGAQLRLAELIAAGAIGTVFVLARAAGKYFGAWAGARSAGMPREQAAVVGLGLLPQAGLAIGLAYLVRQDASLEAIRTIIINVVVASVVVNELIGPPLVRVMAIRAGELPDEADAGKLRAAPSELESVDIAPWTWPKLEPPARPHGFVLACLSHPGTARGLTRIATVLGHSYGALPLAVHVITTEASDDFWASAADQETVGLFRLADEEARGLGYELNTEVEFGDEVSEAILRVAETENVQAIVLGHPLARQAPTFSRIVDAVARDSLCPVVIVKLAGALHTERILVPVSTPEEFAMVRPVLCALAGIEEHQITLLRLLPPETSAGELDKSLEDLSGWYMCEGVPGEVTYRPTAAESRVHEIVEVAGEHDIVVMATTSRTGLRRAFFGSLAEDVAQRCRKPMLLVRGGMESYPRDELT